jgi:hypothetical protein
MRRRTEGSKRNNDNEGGGAHTHRVRF